MKSACEPRTCPLSHRPCGGAAPAPPLCVANPTHSTSAWGSKPCYRHFRRAELPDGVVFAGSGLFDEHSEASPGLLDSFGTPMELAATGGNLAIAHDPFFHFNLTDQLELDYIVDPGAPGLTAGTGIAVVLQMRAQPGPLPDLDIFSWFTDTNNSFSMSLTSSGDILCAINQQGRSATATIAANPGPWRTYACSMESPGTMLAFRSGAYPAESATVDGRPIHDPVTVTLGHHTGLPVGVARMYLFDRALSPPLIEQAHSAILALGTCSLLRMS